MSRRFSDIPVTIQYNTHTSSQGPAFSYTIRSSAVVQKHTLEHTHIISSCLLGSIKNFIGYYSMEHRGRGRATFASCKDRHTVFFFDHRLGHCLAWTARISYHWEGSDGAVWWDGGAWMTLCSHVLDSRKSSVLSAIVLLRGNTLLSDPVLYFNSSSTRRASIANHHH